VAAGVTVVSSSGDAGPFNNIGSPATTPGVIAAGGTTTYRVYRQTSRYNTNLHPGGWENNNITALSSDGITQFNPHTVDVVAPGDRGWSLCSTNITAFFGCRDIDNGSAPGIWAAGGTSASAPETSGTAALVIQAYENTHGGEAPPPALVERIITSTASDLGAPADHQGAGLVNTLKAVQLAESINTNSPDLAAVANTNPFDPAVTSTSGDVWAQSVNASAPYSPLTLGPGQKGTITLTITPNAPKGTVVHGFMGVDTLNLATASGDELVNIPYTYKVG